MIIRSIVVLALYHSLIFAIPDAGRQFWKRSLGLSISESSAQPTTSPAPTVTEQPLLLAANHSIQHHSNTSHHVPINTTHHASTIVRKPTPIAHLPVPGQTVQPGAVRPPPGSGHNSDQPSTKGPSVAQIFFEVIGGVAGTVVFLAVLRCIYVYRKTPTNRHPPTPDVAEIDRTLALLRTVPFRSHPDPPPPPPYQPAPDYEVVVGEETGGRERQPLDRSRSPPEPA